MMILKMICEDDLILAKRAMENSKKNTGYILKTKSGKRYISDISEIDVFKKAISELEFEYILIASQNKNIKSNINIKYIQQKVRKNFKIYFLENNEIKEYKI